MCLNLLLLSPLELHRVGRGKPVNRQALKDSDCCGTFLETVVEKTEELNGDGESLIQALAAGEIKGFRTQKRSGLEQHLEDHGFIDLQKVLSPTEIDDRVRVDTYKDIETDLLSAERLRWLIQQALRDDS